MIVGGESGPKARPFDLAWARSLRDQCRAASVAYFFKQTGSNVRDTIESSFTLSSTDRPVSTPMLHTQWKPKDRAGADPAEWPEDLRVREWPKGRS